MIIIEAKMLRDANAGKYTPTLRGLLRTLIYPTTIVKREGLLSLEVDLVDISFYQRFAVFPLMMSHGVRGAIIRAGQNLWEDDNARIYMTDALAAGMPIGSYWYFDSRVDPKAQARLWKKVLEGFKTPLFCWADYEETYNGPYSGWRHFYDFLEACKVEMPDRNFGIYTGYYYWIEHSPNPITQAASINYFAQYPLWLAWYAPDIGYVRIPKPWTKMTFWQWTDKGDGTKYGVGSLGLDMNKFIGTPEEFKTMFDLQDTGGGEMPDITFTGTVASWVTAGAIVRDAPNGADTGQRIPANAQIKGTGTIVEGGSFKWMNVVYPTTGWVADHLLVYQPVAPTPTPDTPHLLEIYVDGVLEFTKEF